MPLEDVLEQYANTRRQEQEALLHRQAHAYQAHPDFLTIAQEKRAASLALTSNIQKGVAPAAAIDFAQSQLTALQAREEALLLHCGLPSDYLQLHFQCALCKDTGYTGEPLRKPCTCLEYALGQAQLASNQINSEETFASFDDTIFPSDAQRAQMQNAKKAAEAFAGDFPQNTYHNLVFVGQAGLGKSFLLNAIAYACVKRGFPAKKLTAYHLQECMLQGIRARKDVSTPLFQTPLLLIDDLGTEPMLGNITLEALFTILNERRNGKKHTVIATNLDLQALQARYGERIFSRLVSGDDSRILQLSGKNLRLLPRRQETP